MRSKRKGAATIKRFKCPVSEIYRPWTAHDKTKLLLGLKDCGEDIKGLRSFLHSKSEDEILCMLRRYKLICKKIYTSQCEKEAPNILQWISVSKQLVTSSKIDDNKIIERNSFIGKAFDESSLCKNLTEGQNNIFSFGRLNKYVSNILYNQDIAELRPFEYLILLTIIQEIELEASSLKCLGSQLISRARNMRRLFGFFPSYFMENAADIIIQTAGEKGQNELQRGTHDAEVIDAIKLTEQDISQTLHNISKKYAKSKTFERFTYSDHETENPDEDVSKRDQQTYLIDQNQIVVDEKAPFSGYTMANNTVSDKQLITTTDLTKQINLKSPTHCPDTNSQPTFAKLLPIEDRYTHLDNKLADKNINDDYELLEACNLTPNKVQLAPQNGPCHPDLSLKSIEKDRNKRPLPTNITNLKTLLPQFHTLPQKLSHQKFLHENPYDDVIDLFNEKNVDPALISDSNFARDRFTTINNSLVFLLNPFCLPSLPNTYQQFVGTYGPYKHLRSRSDGSVSSEKICTTSIEKAPIINKSIDTSHLDFLKYTPQKSHQSDQTVPAPPKIFFRPTDPSRNDCLLDPVNFSHLLKNIDTIVEHIGDTVTNHEAIKAEHSSELASIAHVNNSTEETIIVKKIGNAKSANKKSPQEGRQKASQGPRQRGRPATRTRKNSDSNSSINNGENDSRIDKNGKDPEITDDKTNKLTNDLNSYSLDKQLRSSKRMNGHVLAETEKNLRVNVINGHCPDENYKDDPKIKRKNYSPTKANHTFIDLTIENNVNNSNNNYVSDIRIINVSKKIKQESSSIPTANDTGVVFKKIKRPHIKLENSSNIDIDPNNKITNSNFSPRMHLRSSLAVTPEKQNTSNSPRKMAKKIRIVDMERNTLVSKELIKTYAGRKNYFKKTQ